MALRYLDTSALVKLYVREPGTDAMLEMARREEGHELALLALARVELVSGLRRRQREGDLDAQDVAAILARFERHLASRYLVQPVNDAVLGRAVELLERHPLKAYDALQLAGALALQQATSAAAAEPMVFVCADLSLLRAAAVEGLATLDPADRPA